ncbi:MAG TPA: RNA-binding S4 domain-containing protein [Vicinamibacteria bacterium]|nr:RNA-binding S4 domain-containing protein [Vicinamibacteria bacterium]
MAGELPHQDQPASERLDLWLDVACLFKTRSLAQRACRGGKVEVNGQVARPHRMLHLGDELRISRGGGWRQVVVVRGLALHHLVKAEARTLYEDRTPPATAEEIEARRLRRAFGLRPPASRPPSSRERRAIRRLKEGG